MNPENSHEDWLARFGWTIVLTAVLSMSAYSLFYVGRHLGMPWYFAAIVSLCFDGTALLASDYSLRYARMGLAATGPQLTVFMFGGLSAYLNTLHAYFGNELATAKILWAAPPVAAILVFEFHTRWARLSALREAGRVADALPPLGRHAWIHHPVESLKTIRVISGERLTRVIEREAPGYVAKIESDRMAREAEARQLSSERAAIESEESRERSEAEDIRKALDRATSQAERVRVALRYAPEGAAKDYVAWLESRGITGVNSVYVRQIRALEKRRETEENRRGIRAV